MAREYVVPELLDAYLAGDAEALREWCSEATFQVLTAGIHAQSEQGLVSDSRILDIRQVELVSAKVLENQVPVAVVSFTTQEVILFRDRKTGDIRFGSQDRIQRVVYAMVLTRVEDEMLNPVTGGWRVIDMAKHDARDVW